DIGGRYAEASSEFAAVHHPPGHLVRPPEELRRRRKIADLERGADTRAAHAPALDGDRRLARHLESVAPGGIAQHGKIARAVLAEAKIIPDHEIASQPTVTVDGGRVS